MQKNQLTYEITFRVKALEKTDLWLCHGFPPTLLHESHTLLRKTRLSGILGLKTPTNSIKLIGLSHFDELE